MTTKRKLIITTLAKAGTSTLSDLVDATGMERRNLQDNLKACVEDGLVDKLKEEENCLPVVAYKVSTNGQKWLANAGNQLLSNPKQLKSNSSVTTQAVSGDITTASAHCATSLASVASGKGADVIEPPKPDEAPVAVRSDENSNASASITEFCQWLANLAKVRRPINLREAKKVIAELDAECGLHANTIKTMQATIAAKDADLDLAKRLGNEMANQLLEPAEPAAFIGYVVMPDYPDMTIHQSLETARAEAEAEAMENSPVHVVAIVDTAEVAVKWKNAA